MSKTRKSKLIFSRASKPVVEALESRQLLSATLTISSSLMVFNAVENASASTVQTLTLTNTGDAALTLSPSAFSVINDSNSATPDAARFSLLNVGSAPATLSPGSSFGLQLDYNANAVLTNSAILQMNTNSQPASAQQVTLRGIGTVGLGGSNQPSLATILRAYNIPTIVGEGTNDADAAADSIYPNPPDASSQEVTLQRLQKAGIGAVSITVLASFTASGFSKSYTLGTYTPGDATSLSELFYTPSDENQTTSVQPQGSTSFDPGNSQFGFYFISNVQQTGRVGYSEDALNTWDTTNSRKFRFFPMKNADGTIVPNTYIMTSTEWNAPGGYDFTNLVAIVHNVKAATAAPAGPVLGLQNLDAVPGSNTIVFNRISSPNTQEGDVVHDTGVLQVSNTGASPLIISSYSLTTGWILVSPPTFPVTVAASGALDLTIKYILNSEPSVPHNETSSSQYPNGGGVYNGNLILHSNDTNNPTASVPLAGWYQYHSENSNEPSLQSIVNLLFGWSTNINSTYVPELSESLSSNSTPTYYGEETVSAYWTEADPTQSVNVEQIAAYHGEGNTAVTYWYPQGSPSSSNTLFVQASDDGQTLLPYGDGTTNLAEGSFNTMGNFGFRVDSEYSDDSLNGFPSGGGHHFRFYPVRTAVGILVPNEYIATMDYGNSGQNFDFQDNVLLISNICPVTTVTVTAPQTTAAPAAVVDLNATTTTGGNLLQWAPISDSNLSGYNVYRANSLTGNYTKLTNVPIASASYIDATALTSGISYYKVTALDSVLGTESLGISSAIVNVVGNGSFGTPVAAAVSTSTRGQHAITINELAAATDNASVTIISSTVTISSPAGHGTTSVNASNGAITYTPAAGFTGSDTFQYTVSDSAQVTSAPATITVLVIAGNPVAANLSQSVAENGMLTVTPISAATDSNGTILANSVLLTQTPGHGSAVVNSSTGAIFYTPSLGFSGSDTFQYTVADDAGTISAPATITVTVVAPPPAPVVVPVGNPIAQNLSYAVNENTPLALAVAGTDSTGTIIATSTSITQPPAHGTATVDAATGDVLYIPALGYRGTDTILYTLRDSLSAVSTAASLTLTVAGPVLSGPVAINVNAVASTAGSTAIIDVLSSATDGLGTLSDVAISTAPLHGLVSVDANTGKIGYTPAIGFVGSDLLQYTVVDSNDLVSAPATVTLNVGVTINNTTAKSLTFVDGDGSKTTVTLSGGGSAQILFTGTGSSKSIPGAHGTGTLVVSGTALGITGMNLTGTNAASTLTITRHGASSVAIGGISVAGSLGRILASTTSFTGTFSVAGSLGTLQTGSISSAKITVGLGGALTMAAGHVLSTALYSGEPIRTIKALDWSGGAITAPAVSSLVTTGNFSADITVTGVLGTVRIGGGLADADITAGTLTHLTITGRGTNFADSDISAQTIGTLSLGRVATNNAGVAFGITGGTISSLAATLDTGRILRMNRTVLAKASSIDIYLTLHDIALRDFVIV